MKLDGKCTIVTGASRGIGRAVTLDLLNRGAAVSGWARTSPEIENPNFHFVKVDVGDIGQVNKAYDQTTSRWEGRGADILINNAGLGFEANFEKLPVEDWQKMFRTNVDGVFYCTRKVIARMKEEGEGHIVNISSVAGNVGIPKMAAYCGTKYAVKGMSHALYKELRNYGIKVSCIYPGGTHCFRLAPRSSRLPENAAPLPARLSSWPSSFLVKEGRIRRVARTARGRSPGLPARQHRGPPARDAMGEGPM